MLAFKKFIINSFLKTLILVLLLQLLTNHSALSDITVIPDISKFKIKKHSQNISEVLSGYIKVDSFIETIDNQCNNHPVSFYFKFDNIYSTPVSGLEVQVKYNQKNRVTIKTDHNGKISLKYASLVDFPVRIFAPLIEYDKVLEINSIVPTNLQELLSSKVCSLDRYIRLLNYYLTHNKIKVSFNILKNIKIIDNCKYSNILLNLNLPNNLKIINKSLKIRLSKANGQEIDKFLNSDGRIIFDDFKHKDFPIKINCLSLDSINQKLLTINDPVTNINEIKDLFNLLDTYKDNDDYAIYVSVLSKLLTKTIDSEWINKLDYINKYWKPFVVHYNVCQEVEKYLENIDRKKFEFLQNKYKEINACLPSQR